MHLTIGVILLAVTAVLIFVGLPKRNGDSPRFLEFEAAIVPYPLSTAHYDYGRFGRRGGDHGTVGHSVTEDRRRRWNMG